MKGVVIIAVLGGVGWLLVTGPIEDLEDIRCSNSLRAHLHSLRVSAAAIRSA